MVVGFAIALPTLRINAIKLSFGVQTFRFGSIYRTFKMVGFAIALPTLRINAIKLSFGVQTFRFGSILF